MIFNRTYDTFSLIYTHTCTVKEKHQAQQIRWIMSNQHTRHKWLRIHQFMIKKKLFIIEEWNTMTKSGNVRTRQNPVSMHGNVIFKTQASAACPRNFACYMVLLCGATSMRMRKEILIDKTALCGAVMWWQLDVYRNTCVLRCPLQYFDTFCSNLRAHLDYDLRV
jgi:hypothetical protein